MGKSRPLVCHCEEHSDAAIQSAENEIASLLGLELSRPLPSLATMGGVIEVSYLLGTPHGYDWRGVPSGFRWK